MAAPLILAIDQGTGSTKCLLVDAAGDVVASASAPLGQSTPRPGWVEQDPREIWQSVRDAVSGALTPEMASRVVAVGLSTQRESCVLWDAASGAPLTPLLSWQDQRTEGLCARLRAAGHADLVRARSGLPLDPMFSAAKACWLLDEIDPDRRRSRAGEIRIGTVDSWLIACLGGPHIVEAGNASRTQLVDVTRADYDDDLLAIFNIPRAALPRIVPSTGPFAMTRGLAPLPDGVPVAAVMADSHSALFAHGVYAPGPVKATQGTGSSVMGLIDPAQAATLDRGVCLTLAWWIDAPVLAFEGNIRACGTTLIWCAEMLGVSLDELAELSASATDSGGAHLVPGFNGLGAPWWDGSAVATLSGFTLGTGRAQIARAAFDSIGQQIADVIASVRASGVSVERLHVDGGPTRNDALMRFEADIIGVPVARTDTAELSALGVAHLAGLARGVFTRDGLGALDRGGREFRPAMPEDERSARRSDWLRAVERSRSVH